MVGREAAARPSGLINGRAGDEGRQHADRIPLRLQSDLGRQPSHRPRANPDAGPADHGDRRSGRRSRRWHLFLGVTVKETVFRGTRVTGITSANKRTTLYVHPGTYRPQALITKIRHPATRRHVDKRSTTCTTSRSAIRGAREPAGPGDLRDRDRLPDDSGVVRCARLQCQPVASAGERAARGEQQPAACAVHVGLPPGRVDQRTTR